MMDILSLLGAQAIGTASTVKPIIAPLFLPASPGASGRAWSADNFAEPREDTQSPAGYRPPPPPLAVPEPLVDLPAPARSGLVPRPATDRGEPDAHPLAPRDAPAAPPRVQMRLESAAEAAHVRPAESEPTQVRLQRATTTDGATRAAQVPTGPPATTPRELPSPHAAIEPRAAAVRLPAVMPIVTPPPALRPDARLEGAAAMLERLRSLGASAPAHLQRRDPVVRVTIGRIEVRATMPAAPEAAAAPVPSQPVARVQPPRLTLAEYLERKREAR